MLVYIILFKFVLCLGIVQYSSNAIDVKIIKKHQVTGKMIVFILTLIAVTYVEAMRGVSVGEDLQGYISWFSYYRMRSLNLETLLDFSAFEPGFMLLYKGIGLFSTTDHAFIVVTSIIIVFLNLFFLYKNSDDYYLSILLFFGFNHFFTSMVSLRQYIAIGIVMWVFPSLNEKRYIRAAILGFVAFFFHMTSIIPVIFTVAAYVVRNHKKVIPWVALVALSILPFANQLFYFFTGFFGKYSGNYGVLSGGSIGYLRLIYIFLEILLIVYVYRKKEFDNKEFNTYSLLLIPAIACGVLTSIQWLFRIGYYFDYYILLLIPKIIANSTRNKKIMRLVVGAVSVLFFAYYLSVNPGMTVPYEFY